MNGDPKKNVAKAQAYFARLSQECQRFLDDAEQIERVLIRDELSEHEKTLSITAARAGVEEFALFRNAGYRGLYNMNLSDLRKLKSIPTGRSPLDFMGKDELAANLFRTTQTDAKIKREHIKGQKNLEAAAEAVGVMVHQTIAEISGQRPEDLPAQRNILNLLRMSPKNLSPEQSQELKAFLKKHPALKVIYEEMQALRALLKLKHQTVRQCRKLTRQLLAFIKRLASSPHENMATLAQTLSTWIEPIARMWRFTKNNGITEGFHRKMKLIQRRAYGFRNFENYRVRVIAHCG